MIRSSSSRMSTLVCQAGLPKSAYKDDGLNISLTFHSTLQTQLYGHVSEKSHIPGKTSEQTFYIVTDDQFLEVELRAAGVKIDGEQKQQRPLALALLQYWWSCYFGSAGTQYFLFLVSVINASSQKRDLGVIQHKCDVKQYGSLSKKDILLLTSLVKIAGFVLLILSIALSVAQLAHVAGLH